MARVKRGVTARRRRKKYLKRAKGYYSLNSSSYIHAREKTDHGLQYAYRDRKVKKRDFRTLWIARISAAARLCGTKYSILVKQLSDAQIDINRKILAELAVQDMDAFSALVKKVQAAA